MSRLPLARLCLASACGARRPLHLSLDAGLTPSPSRLSSSLPRRLLQTQAGLLPLPVPDLDASLEKYQWTLGPILNKEEMESARRLVTDFKKSGDGERLQNLLMRHAEGKDNWLADWWNHVAYLGCRDSILIYVNPGIHMPTRRFADRSEWLTFCSRLTAHLMEYRRLLVTDQLPADSLRGDPLDMSPHRRVFNCCRVPQAGADRFERHADSLAALLGNEEVNRVAVSHLGRFYSVLAADPLSGEPLPSSAILAQLELVVSGRLLVDDAADGVGLLGAQQRDVWAGQYRKLTAAHPDNASSLRAIERSAFLLCLDAAVGGERDGTRSCENSLHGGGARANSRNRYFDKTVQAIVAEDGTLGVNYEHASCEGGIIQQAFDFALDRLRQPDPAVCLPDASAASQARALPLTAYQGLGEDVETAAAFVQAKVDNLQLRWSEFAEFGKNLPKQCRLSPDAFFQVCLQLAYHRLHGEHCATYESGSLRRFHRGRTDTIRSCTPEAANFCRLFSSGPSEAAASAFVEACGAHSRYTNEVLAGRGIDRHFLGLKLAAQAAGQALHPLLTSPVHEKFFHFKLSTSQVPGRHASTVCFGPVVSDGYGVCYNVLEDRILFCVTAYRDCAVTDADSLTAALRAVFVDVRRLLLRHVTAKAKL